MLQRHANDPAFLRQLREAIPIVKEQLNAIQQQLLGALNLQPHFRQGALSDIAKLHQMLDALAEDRPFDGKTCLKLMANAVWLWPMLVPSPLLANQPKTFAYTQAAASKAVLAVGGSLLRPTADGQPWPLGGGELGHHSNEVHFYPALLNFVYGSVYGAIKWGHGTKAGKVAETLEHSAWFHVLMAVTCGTVLTLPFVQKQVKQGLGQARSVLVKTAALAISPLFQARAQAMRANLTPGRIDRVLRGELRQTVVQLWRSIEDIERLRNDFTLENRELTRTLNSQITRLLDELKHFAGRVEEKLDLRNPNEAPGAPARNPDFASKVALTLFASLVTAATVVLIQPDRIGTVDLAADAVVVTAAMMLCAASKSATRQDAMERFKGMAATSMVMCLALGADKMASAASGRGIIDRNSYTPYVAGALMTLMAWTLPGPVARTAELALNAAGRGLKQLASGPPQRDEAIALQGLAQREPSPAERLEEVRQSLGAMSPAAAQEFINTTGDNLLARLT